MTPPVLHIIIGSTRPGRVGPAIAQWFTTLARSRDDFTVELIDLADYDLPLYDEPQQPITRQYTKEHTRRWSATITRGDAFVFVIPEYNHSFNAATKNALDFLYHEWRHKPTGILSYGGGAMGTRSAQALKPVLASLKLVHAGDVSVALASAPVVEGHFDGNEFLRKSANTLLDELALVTPMSIERRRRSRADA